MGWAAPLPLSAEEQKGFGDSGDIAQGSMCFPRRQMNRCKTASITFHSPAVLATYEIFSAVAVDDKINPSSSRRLGDGFVIFLFLGQHCTEKPVADSPSSRGNGTGKESLSRGLESCSLPIPITVGQQCWRGKGLQTFRPALG